MPVNATELTLDQELDTTETVVVDFWAAWCGPCRMLTPTLEALEAENENLKVVKVNIDEESELARDFGVMSIPTMIVVKDKEAVKRIVGVKPKNALQQELATYL